MGPFCTGGGWVEYKEAEAWLEMFANIRRFSSMTHQRRASPPSSWNAANPWPAPTPKIKQPTQSFFLKNHISPKDLTWLLWEGNIWEASEQLLRTFSGKGEDCKNSKECACVVRMGLFRKSGFVTLLILPNFLLSDFLIENLG